MEIGFQKMHSVEFVLFMQRVSDNREEKAKEAEDDMPAIPSLSARKRCIITLAKSIIALYYLSSLPLGMPDGNITSSIAPKRWQFFLLHIHRSIFDLTLKRKQYSVKVS
ncbi:unnamed protein product [Cuscuta epithymum]|uniref:Uncharacterized protein n=1 Tax=Cuscuta epithymum TaxID=186058 RepID=A0AAV0E8N5_9ASTE|nr:unnamed protein product [Cuscuta epithymum]